jgi:pimeloyl-ACP methyl ester carboxylesterase
VPAPRVQFIHGLEGSPQGAKARLLAQHFPTHTPAMDTRDLEVALVVQAEALTAFRPDVLVGSSFGAALAVELLARGLWRGPTLLLAQAAVRMLENPRLPEGVRVWLVHGLHDTLVDPEESRRLARSGTPGLVRLIEVDDDHPLRNSVERGDLVAWVRDLAAEAGVCAGGHSARHST